MFRPAPQLWLLPRSVARQSDRKVMTWMTECYINPDHREAKTIGRLAPKASLPHAGSVGEI